jgi:LPPG:FO 2-phospho-L-lactate transferase
MNGNVVVLTGGVGGAKLVLGLARLTPPENITVIVNTGDDFTHLGLFVSPDIDTLLYTLSDKANAVQGWGREDESWSFMAALKTLGGEDWFQLGDGDLALHVLRTQALAAGKSLSSVIAGFARGWGITTRILPMTDQKISTMLTTDVGEIALQDYFVARHCAPTVEKIRFEGARDAEPAPGVLEAIAAADVILLAPSNPFLSIDPILAVPGIASALAAASAPVVAISPLIGGHAVKGPTEKLMKEMLLEVTTRTIALHYAGLINGLVVDERDAPSDPGIAFTTADTLMHSLEDRIRVARAALKFAGSLRK